MRKSFIVGGIVAAVALVATTGLAGADGRPMELALSGANEFDAAGEPINPHGNADRGSVKVTFNAGQGEVCWTFGAITLTQGDALPHVAHIHQAPVGVSGRVVIDIFGTATTPAPPTVYPTDTTCVPAERDRIRAILEDPADYYINLHNAQHPGGVMRAQLER